MMRKELVLSFMLSVVFVITGCTLNPEKNFTDWEVVTLEGVGSFRLPPEWSMERIDSILTGYDQNHDIAMLEITEDSVYWDCELLDEYGEVFSNSSSYGKYKCLINEKETELFMVDFPFDTVENEVLDSLSFVFLNPNIAEEYVRKIAMSYEMELSSK